MMLRAAFLFDGSIRYDMVKVKMLPIACLVKVIMQHVTCNTLFNHFW